MITDLLKVASESYTYQQLSEILGLSPPILSRYMRGHVLPSYSRAQGLYETLQEITNIKEAIEGYILALQEDNLPVPPENFESFVVAV